ncbi:MAG: hypothetical protein ACU837_00050 [Gammaproteobacteria bacterium]
MNRKHLLTQGLLGLLGLIFSTALLAHGGAAGTDVDQCKIKIQDEWVHFTAYQPFTNPAEEFCESIPNLDTPTNLVFDYVGMKLRKMMVEFEITKEPEGTRVYYQAADKHKTGTINATMTFKEKGNYLVHVKLIPETGEPVDAHIGFSAGGGVSQATSGNIGLILLFVGAGLYVLYLSSAGFKKQVDGLLAKIKSW